MPSAGVIDGMQNSLVQNFSFASKFSGTARFIPNADIISRQRAKLQQQQQQQQTVADAVNPYTRPPDLGKKHVFFFLVGSGIRGYAEKGTLRF